MCVCVCVCVSVCEHSHDWTNQRTVTKFDTGTDLDEISDAFDGQGQRSRSPGQKNVMSMTSWRHSITSSVFVCEKGLARGRCSNTLVFFFYIYFLLPDQPTGQNWLVTNPPFQESSDHGLRSNLSKYFDRSAIEAVLVEVSCSCRNHNVPLQ